MILKMSEMSMSEYGIHTSQRDTPPKNHQFAHVHQDYVSNWDHDVCKPWEETGVFWIQLGFNVGSAGKVPTWFLSHQTGKVTSHLFGELVIWGSLELPRAPQASPWKIHGTKNDDSPGIHAKKHPKKKWKPQKRKVPMSLQTSIFSGCKTSKAGCSTRETGNSSKSNLYNPLERAGRWTWNHSRAFQVKLRNMMITFRAFFHSKTFPIFGLLGEISERFHDVKPKLTNIYPT